MSQGGTSAAEKLQKVLHYLVRDCGHLVKLLCTRGGCDKDAVLDSQGWRLVHQAAAIGASKALQALLECGADVSLQTASGFRALHLAAQEGKLDCISILLRSDQPVDCRTQWKYTPLMYAAQNGRIAVVRRLIRAGANVNAKGNRDGRTSLLAAAESGHAGIIATLLNHGADANAADDLGHTAIMATVVFSHVLAMKVLLRCRVDARIFSGQGLCVWHQAARRSSSAFLELLLRFFKADVDIRTRPGVMADGRPTPAHAETALHKAAEYGSFECLRFLLQHGADRTAVDSRGWTPLHHAALKGQLTCLRVLMGRRGESKLTPAQVNARSKNGKSALHMAAENGSVKACALLMEAGGDPSIRDNDGYTPLRFARHCHPGKRELHRQRAALAVRRQVRPLRQALDGVPQGAEHLHLRGRVLLRPCVPDSGLGEARAGVRAAGGGEGEGDRADEGHAQRGRQHHERVSQSEVRGARRRRLEAVVAASVSSLRSAAGNAD
jgi:ankyrin repeat protein